jgi:hypothetical protein
VRVDTDRTHEPEDLPTSARRSSSSPSYTGSAGRCPHACIMRGVPISVSSSPASS